MTLLRYATRPRERILRRHMSLELLTRYLQALSVFLAALLSLMQAVEAYPKVWKILVFVVLAGLSFVMAWHRLWPIF